MSGLSVVLRVRVLQSPLFWGVVHDAHFHTIASRLKRAAFVYQVLVLQHKAPDDRDDRKDTREGNSLLRQHEQTMGRVRPGGIVDVITTAT